MAKSESKGDFKVEYYEGDAEADRRLGVIPRHCGDELLADQPLRKGLSILKLNTLAVGLDRRLGRAHVEEK